MPIAAHQGIESTIAGERETHLWTGFADGRFKTFVQKLLPPEPAAEAHRLLDDNGQIGKVVPTVGGG